MNRHESRQNFPSAADKMRFVAAELQERAEALAAEAASMAATAAQLRCYADNLDDHGDIMPSNYQTPAPAAASETL